MATLIELCESEELIKIDPLEDGELPWRCLYATVDFIDWLNDGLSQIPHNALYSSTSPEEQVFALFAEYVAGDEFLDDRRFKKLYYNPELYVWEFKTEEVRIFGWVPQKDIFICCYGDSKDTIVTMDSYGKYIAMTAYYREQVPLDEPKFLATRSVNDVISTKT